MTAPEKLSKIDQWNTLYLSKNEAGITSDFIHTLITFNYRKKKHFHGWNPVAVFFPHSLSLCRIRKYSRFTLESSISKDFVEDIEGL